MLFRKKISLIGKKVTDEDVVSNLWVLACTNCKQPWKDTERQHTQVCPNCWDLRSEPRLITFDEIRQCLRGQLEATVRFDGSCPWKYIPEGIRSIPEDVISFYRDYLRGALDRGDLRITRRRQAIRENKVYGPFMLGSIWRKLAGKINLRSTPPPRAGIGWKEG